MKNPYCILVVCNKRDSKLLPYFVNRIQSIAKDVPIVLGNDKNFPVDDDCGLKTVDIDWSKYPGKRIAEAMGVACMMTKSNGCVKMDVDCWVNNMDWVRYNQYSYIGHGLKYDPNYPIGLSYYIEAQYLYEIIKIPCARFQCKDESNIIFKNLSSIPRDKRKIYSPTEKIRKVAQYSWGDDIISKASLVHLGEYKTPTKNGTIYDREKTLECFKILSGK